MNKIFIFMLPLLLSGCVTSNDGRWSSTKALFISHPQCESDYPIFSSELASYSKADIESMVLARMKDKRIKKKSISDAIYPRYLYWGGYSMRLTHKEISCVIDASLNLAIKYNQADTKAELIKAKEEKEADIERQKSIIKRKKWESSREGITAYRACLSVGQEIAHLRSFDSVEVERFDFDNKNNIVQCMVGASGKDAFGSLRVQNIIFIYNLKNNMYEVTTK